MLEVINKATQPINKSDISELAIPYAAIIREWQSRCISAGINAKVYFTYRSLEAQRALYAQGRQILSGVNSLRLIAGMSPITQAENKIVTKSMPGLSWHNYRLAIDFVILDKDGKAIWSYGIDKIDYDAAAKIASQIDPRCIWGGTFSFGDYGHIEWHPGMTIRSALQQYMANPNKFMLNINDANFWPSVSLSD